MAAQRGEPNRASSGSASIGTLVQVLGCGVLFLAPVAVLFVWFSARAGGGGWSGTSVSLAMILIALLLLGALTAGVLLAAGTALRQGGHLGGGDACSCTDGAVGDHHGWESGTRSAHDMIRQIRAAVHEIRDISLHDPAEREAVRERIHANLQRAAAEQIIDAINDRHLGHARRLLDDAEAAYGESPTLTRLHDKIRKATIRHEPLDYAHTKRMIEELVAEGDWDTAEHIAHELCFDHPDSERSKQLWDDTRRARLYAHIRQCADEHLWSEALAGAKEFLDRFPDSLESKALAVQIETLAANAEIQHRKQYEAKFKTHIDAEQWVEALRIARHLVERFPKSPQAEALRYQIPRLEKRLIG